MPQALLHTPERSQRFRRSLYGQCRALVWVIYGSFGMPDGSILQALAASARVGSRCCQQVLQSPPADPARALHALAGGIAPTSLPWLWQQPLKHAAKSQLLFLGFRVSGLGFRV